LRNDAARAVNQLIRCEKTDARFFPNAHANPFRNMGDEPRSTGRLTGGSSRRANKQGHYKFFEYSVTAREGEGALPLSTDGDDAGRLSRSWEMEGNIASNAS
jgi:hypothetical protein